jgi:choline-sulfatase
MPDPCTGDPGTDHMDEQIPWMNRMIWADDISAARARALKARYYGEITYIDDCIGRMLDAVDAGGRADNVLICFFSDHGEHLGDHRAWQKESFFEASCRVPFLVSWPERLPANELRDGLACLTDLFGIATRAAGEPEVREGVDLLAIEAGDVPARALLAGYYGGPGTARFKIMVREANWKYIYLANGGREQLFDLAQDPQEQTNLAGSRAEQLCSLRDTAVSLCRAPGARDALDGDSLRAFEYSPRQPDRIYQFDRSRGVTGFPETPAEGLASSRTCC